MSDEAKREPDADEPVIRVDKRQTRRQKREEETAAEAPVAEPASVPADEPEYVAEPVGGSEFAPPEESEEEAYGELPDEGAPKDPFAGLNMYDQLRFLITMFNSLAWIHLGVQVPPGASETRTDLPQARLAIDMIAVIKEKLSGNLSPAEHGEVETLLGNLRVNYLQRQTQSGSA